MTDICIEARRTETRRNTRAQHGWAWGNLDHVRVFSTDPETVSLQIRAVGKLVDGGRGADVQTYSIAKLERDQAIAIRDALSEAIAEKWPTD